MKLLAWVFLLAGVCLSSPSTSAKQLVVNEYKSMFSGTLIEAQAVAIIDDIAKLTANEEKPQEVAKLVSDLQALMDDTSVTVSFIKAGQIFEDESITNDERLAVSRDLRTLGFYEGVTSMEFSEAIRKGIRDFQRAIGMPATGFITAAEFELLRAEADYFVSADGMRAGVSAKIAPELEPTMNANTWAKLQNSLNRSGMHAGNTDGVPLTKTNRAIRSWQRLLRMPEDGILTLYQFEILTTVSPFQEVTVEPRPRRNLISRPRGNACGEGGPDGPRRDHQNGFYYAWNGSSGNIRCTQCTMFGQTAYQTVGHNYCIQTVGIDYGFSQVRGVYRCFVRTPSGKRIEQVSLTYCQDR